MPYERPGAIERVAGEVGANHRVDRVLLQVDAQPDELDALIRGSCIAAGATVAHCGGRGHPKSETERHRHHLGVSGRWGVARAGFTELVGRVYSGEVGAIFGLEISRLARSNAEVARLMEFASITETLLIDADGVYDPGDVNDRMRLGMKSTIGEVELHVMAQRLQASKRPRPAGASYAPRCRSDSSTTIRRGTCELTRLHRRVLRPIWFTQECVQRSTPPSRWNGPLSAPTGCWCPGVVDLRCYVRACLPSQRWRSGPPCQVRQLVRRSIRTIWVSRRSCTCIRRW